MQVTISNQIVVSQPTERLLDWCKKNLVLNNPEYAKKARMHLWLGNTPQKMQLFERDGEKLMLPYGCLNAVLQLEPLAEVSTDFPHSNGVKYDTTVPLYDYQEKAVAFLLNSRRGILQSPAGSGKTQMGIALAIRLGVKTLWLTHTRDLLTQSRRRAELYVDKSLLGTITEGKVNIGRGITFATVQTMCNLDLSLYKNKWECVIVDECHRVAGTPTSVTQFSKVLNAIAAPYKYGLSATVHRADGMITATYALLGKIAYIVPKEAVKDKIMQVSVMPRLTEMTVSADFLDTDGTIVYAKLVNHLTENMSRNALILHDLKLNNEHFNLILSDRLNHLEYLMNHLPRNLREQAVMIDGKMTSKKAKALREKAIEDMRQGRKRYLFATYSLAKEGLDIPRLDRLYLTTPQKDYAVITQSVGRVARTFASKGEPIVYDYVDSNIQYLAKCYKKRCTSYMRLGCVFITQDWENL